MTRTEFAKGVQPLSEKEKRYRVEPEASMEFYRSPRFGLKEEEGVLHFHWDIPDELHGAVTAEQCDPGRTLGRITFNKQTRFSRVPLHRHDYIEMNYVYSGECTAVINGHNVVMRRGDVAILDRGVVHTVLPTQEGDILLNCLMDKHYFSASFIERMAAQGPIPRFLSRAMGENQDHDHYLLLHTENSPRFGELMENVFCEYLEPATCTAGAIDSYMNLLFIELVRCYQGEKEHKYRATKRSYITEVLRYMDDNCVHCTLEQAAAHFGYHPNYLSRMVRQATGSNFKDLIADGRLSRAAFLLRSTEAPISRIAQECGYLNQNFFYRKFAARYGCTPGDYRDRVE